MLRFAKRWLGRYNGLQREEIDSGLSECAAHQNNRCSDRRVSFDTALGLALRQDPIGAWDIVGHDNPRKGSATVRRNPRRRKTATGMRQDGSGPGRSSKKLADSDPPVTSPPSHPLG
jgi:hypothetical protein